MTAAPALTSLAGSNYSRHMDPVVNRLTSLHRLAASEAAVLRRLATPSFNAPPGDQLVSIAHTTPNFLLKGWAAYQTTLPDGRRQILRLLVPGDSFGEYPHLAPPFCEIVALTHATCIDAAPVFEAAKAGEAPGLTRSLALAARQHDVQMAASITRLGCLLAYERVTHLLLELCSRLTAARLADGRVFPLPLTQEILADTLGLSIVHTNRVLQRLRGEKLIELRAGVAVLLDIDAVTRIAAGEGEFAAKRFSSKNGVGTSPRLVASGASLDAGQGRA